MVDLNNLGDRLKKRRKELELSLTTLAEMCGTTHSTLSRVENGVIKHLRSDMVVKLANALLVTPAYILGIKEKEPLQQEDEAMIEKNKAKQKVLDLIETLDTKQLNKTYDILSTIFK